jgi:hypothetical protein
MGQTTKSLTTNLQTENITLIENMSINLEISNKTLLFDLLAEEDGDETTNEIRKLVKDKFAVDFVKLPFLSGEFKKMHSDIIEGVSENMVKNLKTFQVGNVDVDGMLVIHMVNELISQIRGGGSRFNMVSATEALVSNMASEAANTIWFHLYLPQGGICRQS